MSKEKKNTEKMACLGICKHWIGLHEDEEIKSSFIAQYSKTIDEGRGVCRKY
jgi:hypothetical protein